MPHLSHRGTGFHFVDVGPRSASPTILFLHGLLVSKSIWQHQIDALLPSRRVVAIDFPGHGQSPPIAHDTNLDDLVDGIVAIVDSLGIGRFIAVGQSLGGIAALHVASRHPGRVQGLVLSSTPRWAESDESRARHRKTLDVAARLGKEAVLRGIALRLFGATTRRTRPDLVNAWLETASALDLESVRRLGEAAIARPDAPEIGNPPPRTMVLFGEEDSLLPASEGRDLAALVGGATLVAVPESGHLIPLERAKACTEELLRFLTPR